MRWMIKCGTFMTMDNENPWLVNRDLVVDKDKIIAIGSDLSPESFAVERVISGKDKLVIPGLINAHLHSGDRFNRGQFDNLPLELWMARFPPIGKIEWTPRECYLRTLLNCIEILKTGTTTVIDDLHHGVPLPKQNIDAVFQAYQDIGMRALLSIGYADKPYYSTIPFLEKLLPNSLKEGMEQPENLAPDEMIALWRNYAQRWRGRVRFILSPSAPQWCTDEFLKKTWNLSEELDLHVIIHVLETKLQAVTGQLFYGKSVVEHMSSLGILTPKTTLAHTVWVSDSDIGIISEGGASIAHNPVSNLKLGSGIAPIRKIIDAGINVGLGTDNNTANDTANLFDTMKLAAVLHKVVDYDYDRWVGAEEIMRMATLGGARCGGLDEETGALSVGMKADMVLLDLNKLPFFPRNNTLHQLVFCEHGESVDTVIVDGKLVVEGGSVTSVNEEGVLDEAMERAEEIRDKIGRGTPKSSELESYVREAYLRCVQKDIGFSAYSGS